MAPRHQRARRPGQPRRDHLFRRARRRDRRRRDKILVATRDVGGRRSARRGQLYRLCRPHRSLAATGRKIWPTPPTTARRRISAARCSTISPPWSPIRAICSGRGRMGPVDAARRAAVMDNYEKGEVTQADKHTPTSRIEQSAVLPTSASNAETDRTMSKRRKYEKLSAPRRMSVRCRASRSTPSANFPTPARRCSAPAPTAASPRRI